MIKAQNKRQTEDPITFAKNNRISTAQEENRRKREDPENFAKKHRTSSARSKKNQRMMNKKP